MATYISILRGINVGGSNVIKMSSLHEMYEGLGFRNVKTYIQSGNVVFQSNDSNGEDLEHTISEGILKQFNFYVPVVIREYSELKKILLMNPFLKETKEDFSYLHITFLSRLPGNLFLQILKNNSYLPDEYFVNGREIYLMCPNGYGKTKLTNNFFENKSGERATTRNVKTIMELVKIAEMLEISQK